MAKKRSKKSSKCPEPFNTLIDLAAAFTLDYIFYKRRKKRGNKRTKIDPYAVAGMAMGMGKLNTTEDVIKLGGFLGAMGAFDEDTDVDNWDDYTPSYSGYEYKPNNNKYAWRLNCEDGSDYGIYPENFETRIEFNNALHNAKECSSFDDDSDDLEQPLHFYNDINSNIDTTEKYVFCRVSVLRTGQNSYYLSADESINVGDTVLVYSEGSNNEKGIVLTVEHHTRLTAPIPPEELKYLIKNENA